MSNLILTEFKFVVSYEDVECNAGEYLWSYTQKNRNYQATFDVIKAMRQSINTTIPAGEKHLVLMLVDCEGELIEVHCREFVNKIMVKRGLYPSVILEAINEFKNKNKKNEY